MAATNPESTKPLNLIQKLAHIRCELKNIKKQGHNDFHNYDYLRAEDIAGDLGDRLAAMNVIVTRDNLKYEQNLVETDKGTDVHVIVTLDYVFLDGDSYNADNTKLQNLRVASIGEGRDRGDKAVPKALTNALKYALTQPLMMRVGDDPEAVADHDKDTGKANHARENGGLQKAADDYSNDFKREAATVAQRSALWRSIKSSFKGDEKAGREWLEKWQENLGVTSKTMTPANIAFLTEELMKRETVEEADIEY